MSDMTTVQLSKKTRDELAALGCKADTFETIVRHLLERAGASK